MIEFALDMHGTYLVFSDDVLKHFVRNQQKRLRDAEAGGQLFARLTRYEIFVEEATGPRPEDLRTRMSYMPNRVSERREIREKFAVGLHYVGDWHTHPETVPHPSPIDQATIADCSKRSSHQLEGFFLAIVGQGKLPECLHVSFHPSRRSSHIRAIPWRPLK